MSNLNPTQQYVHISSTIGCISNF